MLDYKQQFNYPTPLVKFAGVVSKPDSAIKIINFIQAWIFCNKTVPALAHQTAWDNINGPKLGQFYYKIFMLRLN